MVEFVTCIEEIDVDSGIQSEEQYGSRSDGS